MFYSLDKRPGIKALNPTFGVGKLAQRLAEEWRVMNTTEREPYELMARKDKERYEMQLKAYKKGLYTASGSAQGGEKPATPPRPEAESEDSQLSEEEGEDEVEDTSGSSRVEPELDQLCELYQ